MSGCLVKETLALAIDTDGGRHAMYPTALYTLCGRSADRAIVDVVAGDAQDVPDCLTCATTARIHDNIDHSAPASWFRSSRESRAA